MVIDKSATVADIVKKNPLSAKIFYKHGIDFCCGGKIPLSDSCKKHDVSLLDVTEDLDQIDVEKENIKSYESLNSAKEIIAKILDEYHKPLYETLPIMLELSDKVARVHGESHQELIELNLICKQIEADLILHMHKEEEVLFPLILNLELNKISRAVTGPISQMELEHDQVAKFLGQIKKITTNFTPPTDACNSYRGLFAMLERLEFELYEHIYLENNVLHPLALELAQKNNQI